MLFPLGLSLLAAGAMQQDPAPGVSRELARARAQQIRDVDYDLRFALTEKCDTVTGTLFLRFRLDDEKEPNQPVILDWAGEAIESLTINRSPTDPQRVANHIVLPTSLLGAGWNGVRIRFTSRIAATGTPLSLYHDTTDDERYYYTLLVPADAHGLFPCFDQPDLRARFRLELDLPDRWTAVSNAAPVDAKKEEAKPEPAPEVNGRLWRFARTKPLPTYLFAFACGPFAEFQPPQPAVAGITSDDPMRVLLRTSRLKDLDRDAITRLHHDGIAWLTKAFAVPYPFDKLDLVLLPGFPYGGMEHAGAIFYRESALVFDHPPTVDEQVRRSTLVYHELSHQWFGNLVTMRWFDDLWLKEGFATFYGYRAMAALEPKQRAWLRFLQRVKPSAYAVDATPGTTPVFQELQNLADAKSAYGAIVYNKAPAVLRALFSQLGEEAFQAGVKHFLEAHAYGCADWRQLAAALENAARRDLGRWSERWLLAPSMPQVRIAWQAGDDGKVTAATVSQRPISQRPTAPRPTDQDKAPAGEPSTKPNSATEAWPLELELLVIAADGTRTVRSVRTDAASTEISELVGKPSPVAILANPQDIAYGQFVPDAVTTQWLLQNTPDQEDPLVRAAATSALFEAVREAELDPAALAELLLRQIAEESDADTHRWLLSRLTTCIHRYLGEDRGEDLRTRTRNLLLEQLRQDGTSGRELHTFRYLARFAGGDTRALDLCRSVATSSSEMPPGLQPGKLDRFRAAAALIASGAEDADATLDALIESMTGKDIGKELFLARAATPTAASKQKYFEQFLVADEPPEQWTQASLSWFHWTGQQELTASYLRLALDQVDWVKTNRRIFFMPAWLDAFINSHSSPEALATVDEFLAERELSDDVRRKLLQSRDGLERAVRIRQAFASTAK
ncbi:MAG: M1 family metallopeptidase [Planctomycetota bacterium]